MADIQVIVSDQNVNAILETGRQFSRDDDIGEFSETGATVSCVVVTDGDDNDSHPSGGEDDELVTQPGTNAVLCSIRRRQQHRRRHHQQNNSDVIGTGAETGITLDSSAEINASDHCDQEGDSGGCATVGGLLAAAAAAAARRKKHRRGKSKKRKWKPYNKLTWEEKQELEDREARRAHRIREERFAHGQPVAPYNTTQFLMEDHNVQEPDLDNILNGHRQHRESTGTIDSDEYYSSPEDEEEFLQKEFCEVYDNIHAERLSSMTKLELIQEYMHLEDRVEKLEQKLRGELNRVQQQQGVTNVDSAGNLEKILIFQQEVHKLTEENDRLRRENDLLRHESARPPEPVKNENESLDGHQSVNLEPMEHSGNEENQSTNNELKCSV